MVSIFDYVLAAAKDADDATFAESGLKSKPELREIDLAKLQWDPNSTSDKPGSGCVLGRLEWKI